MVLLGVVGTYYFFQKDVGKIDDRLDTIQQQVTPAAPVPEMKPDGGKPAKGKKTFHVAQVGQQVRLNSNPVAGASACPSRKIDLGEVRQPTEILSKRRCKCSLEKARTGRKNR